MPGTLYITRVGDVGKTQKSARIKGVTNAPLTAEGKREALAIGMALQGAPVSTVYTSDLNRAIEGAQLIGAEAQTQDIQPSSNWRGMDEQEPFQAFNQRIFQALQPVLAMTEQDATFLLSTHDSVAQLLSAWIAQGATSPQVDPNVYAKTKVNSNLLTMQNNGQTWVLEEAQDDPESATDKIPTIVNDENKRRKIGMMLRDLKEAAVNSRKGCEEWWETCIEYHRNEMSDNSKPGEGMSPIHIPFSQPRQDMLTAQVCSVVGKQEPYMIANDAAGNGDAEEKKEKALQKFWHRAGFEKVIRKSSSVCTDTNLCWYRVAWERSTKKPFTGLIIDVIPPWNTVLFPPTEGGIPNARMIGHRFYRRVKEVKVLQKAKVYFDDGIGLFGGDTPNNPITSSALNDAGVNASLAMDSSDLQIELFQVCFKYSEGADEAEKWYLATFTGETGVLLACNEYHYSRPWYFDASYIIETSEGYYPAVSVARNLGGLQNAYNLVAALVYNGAQIGAFPPVFGQFQDQKDNRYSYGDMVDSDVPAQNWSPTIRFNGDPLLSVLAAFDRVGDQVARVSSNTMGADMARPTTATEGSIIAAGVSVGLEEYIGNFSAQLPEMAEFTMELLSAHFSDWSADASLLKITQTELNSPCNWDVNGNTPGNTPGAKLAAIDKLSQMAAQFGPQTGIDIYEMVAAALQNSPLSGTDNIQIPKEQFEQQQQAQQQAAQQQQMQAQQPPQGPPGPPPQGAPMPQPMQPIPHQGGLGPQQITALIQLAMAHDQAQQQAQNQQIPPLGLS